MPALLVALVVVAAVRPGLTQDRDPAIYDRIQRIIEMEEEGSQLPACSEAGRKERFELCYVCSPMELVVEVLRDDAKVIGLTRERLQVTAESRLRAARLYTKHPPGMTGALLYVSVNVVGPAVNLKVEYHKPLFDPVSAVARPTMTWRVAATGTHSGRAGSIVQFLSQNLDEFLADYLRVNEKYCPH